MKRNPDLSIRKSESVPLASDRDMNKISNNFELLRKALEENNIMDKPESILTWMR